MPKKVHNKHDKFVRASFSNAERAAAFFESFLPQKLAAELDLQLLKANQESYIQDDLSEYFSDLVFEVPTKGGNPVDLVLLFEHKSAPDKHVLIQIGHYMFSHWFKSLSNKQPLKPIIPVIYYQGKQQWDDPQIRPLFGELADTISSYLPELRHIFIALNTLSDQSIEQIRERLMAAAVLAQKKGINTIKLAEELLRIFQLLPNHSEEGNFLDQLFVYIAYTSEISSETMEKAIEQLPNKVRHNAKSTYAQFVAHGKEEGIQEGIQKGKIEGRIEGRIEGKIEGKIEVILTGFDNGLDISFISIITHLSAVEVTEILKKHGKIN